MRRIFLCLLCLSLVALPVKGAGDVKYVALTFDDGPSGRFTRQLLKGLAARDVQATFLLCGYRMEQYPELTEQIHAAGHEIGCHGYSHSNMQPMSRRDIAGEIEKMQSLLPEGCAMASCGPREAAAATTSGRWRRPGGLPSSAGRWTPGTGPPGTPGPSRKPCWSG